MNYSYLKVFYTVAKLKNFSKAAQELDVTQPAVSRIIANLEKKYSAKLFVRYKSGVILTQEGLKIFQLIEEPMQDLERVEKAIRSRASFSQTLIHIGATSTALSCYVFSYLEKVKTTYPSVNFVINTDSSHNLLEMVEKGSIDFAFITTPFTETSDMESYDVYPLQDILIAPISYQNRIKGPVSISTLTEFPFILLNEHMQFREHINAFLWSHGVHIHPAYETDSSSVLLPFVEHDCGLTFIPEELASESLAKGKCFQVDLIEKIPPRSISFVIKKGKNYSNLIYRIKNEVSHYSDIQKE